MELLDDDSKPADEPGPAGDDSEPPAPGNDDDPGEEAEGEEAPPAPVAQPQVAVLRRG
ncbi:MAG: hypothetical protein M9925_08610 [Chloroflexi bacterium]|nr:hypothetical protein [Chloroflexota bacterium]